LLDLAANQLKWQHVTKSSSYSRLLVIMMQLYTWSMLVASQ